MTPQVIRCPRCLRWTVALPDEVTAPRPCPACHDTDLAAASQAGECHGTSSPPEYEAAEAHGFYATEEHELEAPSDRGRRIVRKPGILGG